MSSFTEAQLDADQALCDSIPRTGMCKHVRCAKMAKLFPKYIAEVRRANEAIVAALGQIVEAREILSKRSNHD